MTFAHVDLASAITTAQPPLFSILPYMHNNDSLRSLSKSYSRTHSQKQVFQKALFILAESLSLIFGDDEIAFLQPQITEGTSFMPTQISCFSSRWILVWADCQLWYSQRPVELRQVVEVRGLEVDRIDEQNIASFPILIYSTPLALVSNIVYHITSLLLLTQRPKLLPFLAGPRWSTSYTWHAQSIVGIATSNDSPVQWDPILVAGLIFVGKDMTHVSQQSVILERLRAITTATGMNLTGEIQALERGWHIAACSEGVIS
jgi:hypothetical protein